MKPTLLCSSLALSLIAAGAGACKKEEAPPPKPKEEAPKPPPATPDAAPKPAGPAEWKELGLSTPESVLKLPADDVYLVSNINGAPTAADDNGYISKIGPDGKVVADKWLDGTKPDVKLDAPKGMGVRDRKLYVADITVIRVFELDTGKQLPDIKIPGVTFLNDVAAADGRVLVTDSGMNAEFKPTGSDAVWELDKKDKPTKLIGGADLKAPNGVALLGGKVWVNTFGSKELFRVEDGKKADVTELPAGGLDGLGMTTDGRFVVSSWEGKALYIGKPGAGFTVLAGDLEAPADFHVDDERNVIVVPRFQGNSLTVVTVPAP